MEGITDQKLLKILRNRQPIDTKSLSETIKELEGIKIERSELYTNLGKLQDKNKVESEETDIYTIWKTRKTKLKNLNPTNKTFI